MKRRRVGLGAQARGDLDAIYDWIAESGSERVARTYVERIERYCRGFDLASERGRRIDERRDDLRWIGFNRQLTIVFTVSEDAVTILRIFRAGLDWRAEMEREVD